MYFGIIKKRCEIHSFFKINRPKNERYNFHSECEMPLIVSFLGSRFEIIFVHGRSIAMTIKIASLFNILLSFINLNQ